MTLCTTAPRSGAVDMGLMLPSVLLVGVLAACASPYPGRETTVVIRQMDRDMVNEICRSLGIRESVNGCYDMGVAYCPDDKAGVATCLHEIRNALFGGFHK